MFIAEIYNSDYTVDVHRKEAFHDADFVCLRFYCGDRDFEVRLLPVVAERMADRLTEVARELQPADTPS